MNPTPIINVNFNKARGKKKTISSVPKPQSTDSYDDDVFTNMLKDLKENLTNEEVDEEENLNDRQIDQSVDDLPKASPTLNRPQKMKIAVKAPPRRNYSKSPEKKENTSIAKSPLLLNEIPEEQNED